MGDPTRLLSAHSDAETLERALLESLQEVEPPAAVKDAIWGQLATQAAALAAAGAGTALGSSAAASASLSGAPAAGTASTLGAGLSALMPKTLLAKLLVVGALSGAGGTALMLQRAPAPASSTVQVHEPRTDTSQPVPRPSTTQTPSAASVEPPVELAPSVLPSEPVESGRAAREQPKRQHKAHARAQRPRDMLSRESQLLTSARAALRAGDLARAQSALARLAADFGHGVLQQEREVLEIELHAARGEGAAAAQAAQRFVSAHPESPHSAKLARFLR
jgi:hypothetical protein